MRSAISGPSRYDLPGGPGEPPVTLPLVLSLLWLCAVLLLVGRALGQGRGLRMLEPTVYVPRTAVPRVTVVVPARDEAANIGACLASLLSQNYPATQLEVVAIDDGSEDETAALIAAAARDDARLHALSCPPLPPGWIGKSHACWYGTQQVSPQAPSDWLCFTDADVRAGPDLLATAMAEVEARGLDLLSLLPRQRFVSFAERLVMPCGLYLLSVRQSPARVQAGRENAVIATGQFILVRRLAYERAGGHAAVRDDVAEDVALAERVQRCGFRIALASGDQLYEARMYTGWRTLWFGVSKNLVEMLGGRSETLAIGIGACLLGWTSLLLPAFTASRCLTAGGGACLAFALAGTGSAAAVAFHIGGTLLFEIPLWYALLFPLGYTIIGLLAADSVRRRLLGRTRWKGRVYPHLRRGRPTPTPPREPVTSLQPPQLD